MEDGLIETPLSRKEEGHGGYMKDVPILKHSSEDDS